MIVDRRAAIEKAMEIALPGDTILLAGKGHEKCIITGHEKLPWDEFHEAQAAIRRLG